MIHPNGKAVEPAIIAMKEHERLFWVGNNLDAVNEIATLPEG
jgi:hypothetical protein